ncbi:unnamed protein product [Urochloa humidicola]
MEAALVSGILKAILPKLLSLGHDKYKLYKGVKGDAQFLAKELRMIVGAIEDELSSSSQADDHGAVPRLSVEELRELAHGIEDCIDRLIYHAARQQHSSFVSRSVRYPKTLHTHMQLAAELQRLRKSTEEAHQRKQRYTVPGRHPPCSAAARPDGLPSVSDPRILDADLVGVDGPRADLLEQLAEDKGQPKQQLKVISIVGFCGLGKTALAAQVYKRETGDSSRFEKHAWVCAAHKGPTELLTDMLLKLMADATSSQLGTSDDIGQLCVDLRNQLCNKRYLIVIDDIQTEEQWKNIRAAFPTDNDVASRILVTTAVQSVATACSSATGYVHRMTRLDEECSKRLFSKKACPEKYKLYKQPDSAEILKKCDGQPLALLTVGEFVQNMGWPTTPACQNVCNQLRHHLHTEESFGAMRRVLMRNYTSLPGHALKSCLLYFSMFPSDHPIRKKSLLRRWLAEGFIESQPSPNPKGYFDKLMDRNIIEPVRVSNNEEVRTCQTYGMMREFILHMSISQNFVTLLCDDNIEHQYVRRLSLHQITATDCCNLETINLSLVRSLTIFGKAAESMLDFKKYQLLRVLDLEKCSDLKDDHLKAICNLLLLKYLSIGGKVTRLPKDIAKLKDLEVLDAKKLKVAIILPVEVFLLPSLIHLSGKFKLPAQLKPNCELQGFLSTTEKSKLETLAGFVADGSQGYLHCMGRMRKLRKVKIWCESTAGAIKTNWTDVQEAVQEFINDKNDANIGPRSLSLHFDECSEDFLYSLEGPCYLTSLKLHCNFRALPHFIISLRGLVELCLSSVKMAKGLLEALTMLGDLKYLKLISDDLEEFIIKDQAFPNLLRLCVVVRRPTFPTIQEGAMPFLSTLQLLCKDLDGLSGIKMEYLKHLKEVILDHRVTPDTRDKWEKAAKEHSNKPKVLLTRKNTDPEESEDTEDSVALVPDAMKSTKISALSERSVQGNDAHLLANKGLKSSAVPKKQNSCEGQSSPDHELNSAFNDMGVSDVSRLELQTEDVSVALEVAATESKTHSVASNGSVQETDTKMPDNKRLESTVTLKKRNICALQSRFNDDLDSTFSNMGIAEVYPLTNKLSETNGRAERESTNDSVALECAKIESPENSVALEESIKKINTQIPVNH